MSMGAASRNSAIVRLVSRVEALLASAYRESMLKDLIGRGVTGIEVSAGQSRSVDIERRVEETGRGSRLYRWLTTEPEPEVIEIDLTKTLSLGPAIRVIDRVGGVLSRPWTFSTIHRSGESATELFLAAPVKSLSLLLGAAVVSNTVVAVAVGEPSSSGLGLRLFVLGAALLGTRVDADWDELREGRVGSALVALLEPPKMKE